jgi:hypothetical protein
MKWKWKKFLITIFQYIFGVLHLWDKYLDPPLSAINRRPFYMRNILNRGELFIISKPSNEPSPIPKMDLYGFHHIIFDSNTGFQWKGDFYDPEFAPPSYVKDVVIGHLAFVLIEDLVDPSKSGVRVYRAHCVNPPIRFVRLLHSGENIVAMGNDPIFTTLISSEGMIYVYQKINVDYDVELFHESDFLKNFGLTVRQAHIFSYSSMLVWGYRSGVSEVWWINRQGGLNNFYHYGVPSAPTDDALGYKGATVEWYIGQGPPVGDTSYGLWAKIVITGTNEWIRLYYYPGTGAEYRMLQASTHDGLMDRFYFDYGTGEVQARDWDVKLREVYSNTDIDFHLLLTEETGRLLRLTIRVDLQHNRYRYFSGELLEGPDQNVRSAFWAKGWENDIPNPRFQVHANGKLWFKAN